MPFVLWARMGRGNHVLDGVRGAEGRYHDSHFWLSKYSVHIGATWRIRLKRPCASEMRPYVITLTTGYLLTKAGIFMAALCNRCGHYIFALWFLSSSIFYLSFFSSPNLSGRRLDVYHTSTHGVALVRI